MDYRIPSVRLLTSALLVFMLALGVSACGDDDENGASGGGKAASGEPIKVVYPGAETGPQSFYDIVVSRSMELAVEEINAKGGVDGRKMEFEFGPDSKSDIDQGRVAAQEALASDPDVLVTSCDYDAGGPQARLANAAGTLAIGCAGAAAYGLKGIGPLTFNIWHSNPAEGAVIGQFLADKFPRSYFLTDTTIAYTKEVCPIAADVLEKNGGTVVGNDTFQNPDKSFSAQVNRIRQQVDTLDAITICSYAPGGPNLIKQLRAAGIDTPIVGSGGGFDGTYWREQIPDVKDFYAAGVAASIYGDDENAKVNDLVERYTENFGEPPAVGHVVIGYSAIEMLAEAVKRAGGSTEGKDLQEALESFDEVPLLAGPTTYTPTCHIPLDRPQVITESTPDGNMRFVERVQVKPEDIDRSVC